MMNDCFPVCLCASPLNMLSATLPVHFYNCYDDFAITGWLKFPTSTSVFVAPHPTHTCNATCTAHMSPIQKLERKYTECITSSTATSSHLIHRPCWVEETYCCDQRFPHAQDTGGCLSLTDSRVLGVQVCCLHWVCRYVVCSLGLRSPPCRHCFLLLSYLRTNIRKLF